MLNNNFSELVKKYEKYQSKKRDRLLLFILIVLALCLAGFYLVANSSFIMNSFKMTTPEKSEIVQEKVKDASDNETKTIAVQKDVVSKEEVVTKPVARVQVDTPKSQELPDKVYNRAAKEIKQDETFKLEVKERKSLYKLLVADKEQNSYESALSVAKFYYSEKNYEKTVAWAVKASKKDSKQSLPWILYAKSKVILGQSKVAQKALSLYLKHNNSKEAQKLLDTLK
jgi:hypothetical protein